MLWEKSVQIPESALQIAHKLARVRKQPSSKAATACCRDVLYAGLRCFYVRSGTENLITLSHLKTDVSLNYIRLRKSHFFYSIKLSSIYANLYQIKRFYLNCFYINKKTRSDHIA